MNESKSKVVNIYAGPCSGKSTTRAALFAELKYRECNIEEIPEYAKDAAWEKRGAKLFRAQEYLFGKQHFRLSRVIDEVDFVITDSPILMNRVYIAKDWPMPSLHDVINEAYDQYNNLDIFLDRGRNYNPAGRNQTLEEAIVLDEKILDIVQEKSHDFHRFKFGRENVSQIINLLTERNWINK
jgi:hypothetical protein